MLNIETLYERRERLCLRFANKSLNVENFNHLFPSYKNDHNMKTRYSPKYEQAKTSSNRYKISTIPHLQRMLNKQAQMQNVEFSKIKFSTLHCHQLPLPHWGHLAVKINKLIIIIIIIPFAVHLKFVLLEKKRGPFYDVLTHCVLLWDPSFIIKS